VESAERVAERESIQSKECGESSGMHSSSASSSGCTVMQKKNCSSIAE
jgi:hypothetical protein